MKQSNLFNNLCFCVLTFISTSSNAALVDRGGGLIYDSDQDLTWTQDAGLSGFRSSWDDATAWAENLVLGGFDDWRLPTTTQFDDPTCSGDVRASGTFTLFFEHRLDCLGGEMELLTAAADPWNNPLFKDVNSTRYWTATPYRDGTDPCIDYPDYDVPCTLENDNGDRTGFYWQWGFTGFDGLGGPAYKTTLNGTADRYAWAVRDGDVGGAPIPPDDIPATTQEGLVYIAVNPCRLVDTRRANGARAIAADSARNFVVSGAVAGQGGNAAGCPAPKQGLEPLAISAYMVAVPTGDSTAGVLAAYPSDQPVPAAGTGATVNFAAGEVVGNTTNIKLCQPGSCAADGQFAILARTSDQHVIVDVQGYYYSTQQNCPVDMVAVGSLCVDKYEASVWNAAGDTQYGLSSDDYPCQDDGSGCGEGAVQPIYARSVADAMPSAFITWYQAGQACANAGKRLPSTQEWQMAATGTPPGTGTGCNFSGAKTASGTLASCISTAGAFDMVGNLSEWSANLSLSSPGGFGTTDNAIAMALGGDFDNTGGGTPSTHSLFIMNGSGEATDDGPNTSINVLGFRCVQ